MVDFGAFIVRFRHFNWIVWSLLKSMFVILVHAWALNRTVGRNTDLYRSREIFMWCKPRVTSLLIANIDTMTAFPLFILSDIMSALLPFMLMMSPKYFVDLTFVIVCPFIVNVGMASVCFLFMSS